MSYLQVIVNKKNGFFFYGKGLIPYMDMLKIVED